MPSVVTSSQAAWRLAVAPRTQPRPLDVRENRETFRRRRKRAPSPVEQQQRPSWAETLAESKGAGGTGRPGNADAVGEAPDVPSEGRNDGKRSDLSEEGGCDTGQGHASGGDAGDLTFQGLLGTLLT